MPLGLIRSTSSAALWNACSESFLGEARDATGRTSFLWIAHRYQRDSLYEEAARSGLPGWLDPPVAFFSELRDLFGIQARPIGILTARLLVARLAVRHGRRLHLETTGRERGPARAHMLDGVFSELLPEGVTPEQLRNALASLDGDGFARDRNDWVADTFQAFLGELAEKGLYDPRSIHAMVAERIERGGLREAIAGATTLHIYGVTSLRGRRRLFQALAEQSEVAVRVYLPEESESSDWDELATAGIESIAPTPGQRRGEVTVQPAPDAIREAGWVARQVKRLLTEGEVRPHEVAVIARSGREDTRLIHQALQAVGVPSTARLRTALAEVPALKALLHLFRAEASGWDYRSLRHVLASRYFGLDIDLRAVDYVAHTRRVQGLEGWTDALAAVERAAADEDRGGQLRRQGVRPDRLREDLPRLRQLQQTVGALQGERREGEWIDLTLDLLGGAWFDLRRRVCRVAGDRYDIVRIDQRGVLALESLLREWRTLVESSGSPFDADEWYTRLRRLLEANELALSTPLQHGVQVLEAHEASLTPFRRTFVIHANDGVFPRASAVGGGVFSDAERARLRTRGLPLSDRAGVLRRERALWRSVTGGASVTITYRTTDANGMPRLPSLMVPAHDPGSELSRTLDRETGATREGDAAAVSRPEVLRREVHRLAAVRRGGDASPIASIDPHALRHAVLSAFTEELRAGRLDDHVRSQADLGIGESAPAAPLGVASVLGIERPMSERPHPWNGWLRDPLVLGWIRKRFGDEYVWSASQLEQYGRRPFDFLLERVLRLGEVEEAEEETTPLAYGTVAHRLLERFYSRLAQELPTAFDERAARVFEETCEEVFRAAEADGEQWLGLPVLWAVRREEARERVRAYLSWELEHIAAKGATPVLIEHRFGSDGDSEPPCVQGADVAGRPTRLRLRGRIDRVDRYGGPTGWLRVIDYKSGQAPSPAGYQDGVVLQTALYMRALEQAGYRDVRSGVYRSLKKIAVRGVTAELKAAGVDDVLRLALSIPGRVRAGLFEAVQARTTEAAPWQAGRELTRSEARISSGSRFDAVAWDATVGGAGGE